MLRLLPRPLFRASFVRVLGISAIAAAVITPLAKPSPAHAWWVRGGWGWHGGVVVGVVPPPVYVAPPIYAPPPVVYAPPPAAYYYPPPRRVWVPGHWHNGYWIPAHWA
jgi:hypothetical protein